MDLSNILTVEVIAMAVVLVAVVIIGLIILVKMRPLQGFDQIKYGKLELKKAPEDTERDKLQDEALNALLASAEQLKARFDTMDSRLNGMDSRLNGMDSRSDIQYQFIREAAVAAHQSVVWGDKSPPFLEVVRGGLLLAMLEQNGNLIGRMVEVVMGRGREGVKDYRNELSLFINNHKDKLTDRFYKTIDAIEKEIH